MEKQRKLFGFGRNVAVSGLVSFFMDISSEMIYPLVPLFLANVIGVNKSIIGLIEGIAESTASLLKIFSGYFSDKLGTRKWLMAAGYGISALSRPIVALASGWQQVLGFRFMDRFGKGVRTAPRDALIVESADRAFLGRAFSLHRAMDTLGAAIGPALALLLLGRFSNNYQKVFWLSMIPAAIAVLLIIVFITEDRKAPAVPSARPKLTLQGFDWKFKSFVFITAVFALGNSSDVFLILRAQQLGIPAAVIPAIYLLFNLIYSVSAVPAGIMADKFGKKRVVLTGFVLFAALYYGFAVAAVASTAWILFALYGVFMGLTEGIQKAYLATIIPPDFKATAFGVYNAVAGLAMLPASLIGGWLWDNISPSATFYFGAVTGSLSALLFAIFIAAVKRSAFRNVLPNR